jgi:hypothetical protein
MRSSKRKRKRNRKPTKTTPLTREEIDANLAAMGKDLRYLKISKQLHDEFAYSDWEAFLIGESEIHAKAPSRPSRSR